MSIKVRVKDGYMVFYGTLRRRSGDEFYIKNEKEFSEKAMEKIESRPGPIPTTDSNVSD